MAQSQRPSPLSNVVAWWPVAAVAAESCAAKADDGRRRPVQGGRRVSFAGLAAEERERREGERGHLPKGEREGEERRKDQRRAGGVALFESFSTAGRKVQRRKEKASLLLLRNSR